MAGARLETPQPFAAARFESEEVSLGVAAEQHVPCRDEDRSQKPRRGGERPFLCARARIVGGDIALDLAARRRPFEDPPAADERLALRWLLLARGQVIADLLHRDVEE